MFRPFFQFLLQMGDFSDESDINPSEMERMVEELEDLDNTLLRGPSMKQGPFPNSSENKDITEVKKRVAFKDDDDPLADLLSDDDASYGIKKPNISATKSSLVADLFGIKNQKPEEKKTELPKAQKPPEVQSVEGNRETIIPDEHLQTTKKSAVPPAQGRTVSQNTREKSQNVEEKAGKTEDSQKLPSAKARKSSLMEDLFGTRSRSAPSIEIDPRPIISKPNNQNSSNPVRPESSKSEPPTKSSSGYVVDFGTVRESRRGRQSSAVISDPLGLFSDSKPTEPVTQTPVDPEKKKDLQVDKKPHNEDLPEWLGGTGKTKETKMEIEKHQPTSKKEPQTSEPNADPLLQKNHETLFYPDLSTMMGTQFDQQAALITMQQQEHELKTAASLSYQNEQVTKIVENQKAKLDEQAKMFNVLIKHQLDRQAMLETQMKIQQARIDHYIQTLMSQPTSLPTGSIPGEKSVNETEKSEDESLGAETMVKKLELEKLHLENTVEILKEKHEGEITILQESYEKQLSFQRQGMDKLEKKMYEYCEGLENECEKRVVKMKSEKEEIEVSFKEEIERLKKNEKILIEEMYDRHSHNVELLQKEHAETIDEITRAKEIERQAVDTISNHKTDLVDLLQRSELVFENFQQFQQKFEIRNEEFSETRGAHLKKQEEHLQLLRNQLNLQQDSLADERKRLLEIAHNLDVGTAQLTAEFKKNSSLLNETEERLAIRERALIREKQLFDEQVKWEREHLQVIKDAWSKEQERQLNVIHTERESVANERAKLEVSFKLKSSEDEMAKIELEAALKTAQEAAQEASQEKLKWQEKCRSLDAQKCLLREKEKHLVNKAKELETLTQSALKKRDEGIEALKEAKRVEQRHKEHLMELQIQLESLAHRENRKATEKLHIAREKLASRVFAAEKPEKDTNERVSSVPLANDRSFISNHSHISTHFKDVVDPHLLMLKLDLDNKLDTTEELLASMQVISQ
ncbi:fas-binding factor 1 isoform X2 [Venturia canescens]|uniref:fas-binding factor 1 isoform X2 n=1 Tax=Venturia canescens TaxID=32260 RepID=UPI001C9BFA9D|nr:fas-binding factor 1 isoform X2 [Venturia canescens]